MTDESLFSRKSLLTLAGLVAVFVLALRMMGRLWFGKDGIGLWSGAWDTATSQNLFDPYSASHVLHGVIFYGFLNLVARKAPTRWKLVIAVLIEMAWELLENSPVIINRYRAATASLDYFGDSVFNSTGDVLSTVAGFWLATRFNWKILVAIFVVIELAMLLTVRDNLTLNVLMLAHPIQWIKDWQMLR